MFSRAPAYYTETTDWVKTSIGVLLQGFDEQICKAEMKHHVFKRLWSTNLQSTKGELVADKVIKLGSNQYRWSGLVATNTGDQAW